MSNDSTKTSSSFLTATTRLTREIFDQFIEQKTFRLRPSDYGKQYPNWPGAVGLEIEMFPIEAAGDSRPRLLPIMGEGTHQTDILTDLAKKTGWKPKMVEGVELQGQPTRLFSVALDEEDQLTFEPGGQLEFSSKPYPCLTSALERMQKVQGIIDEAMAAWGIHVAQVGMNPWQSVDEVGLQMPKARYRAMTEYFNRLSTFGVQMMRLTGTVQVNLDFGADETTLAKRFLAAQLIAPYTTAIFGNSPIQKNAPWKEVSLRSRCWQNLDSSRTGFPKLENVARDLNAAACRESYGAFALNAQVTFVEALNFEVPQQRLTMRDWMTQGYKGAFPTVADLETHLSLLFPEVRARGFLELRSVDCQARAWQSVPAAYYVSLLYDAKNVDAILDAFTGTIPELNKIWWSSSMGLVDDRIRKGADRLMVVASEGLQRLAKCFTGEGLSRRFHIFKEHFTDRGRSPADELKEALSRGGRGWITVKDLTDLDRKYESWVRG